jgi:hypothetical protein
VGATSAPFGTARLRHVHLPEAVSGAIDGYRYDVLERRGNDDAVAAYSWSATLSMSLRQNGQR